MSIVDCVTCKYFDLEGVEGVCTKHRVVLERYEVECEDYKISESSPS